jgi:hypothetical protein
MAETHWNINTVLIRGGHFLGQAPVELLESAEGLIRVLHYLDAYRGRV